MVFTFFDVTQYVLEIPIDAKGHEKDGMAKPRDLGHSFIEFSEL